MQNALNSSNKGETIHRYLNEFKHSSDLKELN